MTCRAIVRFAKPDLHNRTPWPSALQPGGPHSPAITFFPYCIVQKPIQYARVLVGTNNNPKKDHRVLALRAE